MIIPSFLPAPLSCFSTLFWKDYFTWLFLGTYTSFVLEGGFLFLPSSLLPYRPQGLQFLGCLDSLLWKKSILKTHRKIWRNSPSAYEKIQYLSLIVWFCFIVRMLQKTGFCREEIRSRFRTSACTQRYKISLTRDCFWLYLFYLSVSARLFRDCLYLVVSMYILGSLELSSSLAQQCQFVLENSPSPFYFLMNSYISAPLPPPRPGPKKTSTTLF